MITPQHKFLSEDEEPALVADINITPLVDVVLVLLIVFMVGSSAMVDAARQASDANQEHIDLHLPSASEGQSLKEDSPVLVLGLTKDGRYFADGAPIEREQLTSFLRAQHEQSPGRAVIIDADNAVTHGQVVHILDASQAAGFAQVGIGTEHAAH